VIAGLARVVGARRFAGSVRSLTGTELAAGLVRQAFDSAGENVTIGTDELAAV